MSSGLWRHRLKVMVATAVASFALAVCMPGVAQAKAACHASISNGLTGSTVITNCTGTGHVSLVAYSVVGEVERWTWNQSGPGSNRGFSTHWFIHKVEFVYA